ncbi:MAG: putative methyltransferase [Pseudonocardia sp.]|nr:putative methyltransferase [Pseudonocardia sp.]
MPDAVFEHPRLVSVYDALDPDRSDLDVYVDIAGELGADRVVDVGCGTGTFALLLADRGLQVIGVDPQDWEATLRGVYDALLPGGCLVFETRDPAYRGWEEWNRAASYAVTEIQGVGTVENWFEVTDVRGSLVSFRGTWVFASDGQVLTSDSTLRFRAREEVETALTAHGYVLEEVREAPDRPGREFVFFARRPD